MRSGGLKDPHGGGLLAHELAHYFYLPHPFVRCGTVDEVRTTIRGWVQGHAEAQAALASDKPIPQALLARGLEALDNDAVITVPGPGVTTRQIRDTPADTGTTQMFIDAGLDPCVDPLPITVTFDSKLPGGQPQTHTYSLDPDRRIIVSYFGCGAVRRFSNDQVAIIQRSPRLPHSKTPPPPTDHRRRAERELSATRQQQRRHRRAAMSRRGWTGTATLPTGDPYPRPRRRPQPRQRRQSHPLTLVSRSILRHFDTATR